MTGREMTQLGKKNAPVESDVSLCQNTSRHFKALRSKGSSANDATDEFFMDVYLRTEVFAL